MLKKTFIIFFYCTVIRSSCPFVAETEKILDSMEEELGMVLNSIRLVNERLTTVESSAKIVYTEEESQLAWVAFAQQTSPYIKIVNINNRFFAASTLNSTHYYEIFSGDHNLWVDSNDIFCGFDKFGRMFCHPAYSGYELDWLERLAVEEMPEPVYHI